MMAPPKRIHQRILSELHLQIAYFLKGKRCEVYPAPFAVRLFEQDGDRPENVDTMLEPDITVVCDPGKLDEMMSAAERGKFEAVVIYDITRGSRDVGDWWIIGTLICRRLSSST